MPSFDEHGDHADADEGARLTPTPPSAPRPARKFLDYDVGEAEFQRTSFDEIRGSDLEAPSPSAPRCSGPSSWPVLRRTCARSS